MRMTPACSSSRHRTRCSTRRPPARLPPVRRRLAGSDGGNQPRLRRECRSCASSGSPCMRELVDGMGHGAMLNVSDGAVEIEGHFAPATLRQAVVYEHADRRVFVARRDDVRTAIAVDVANLHAAWVCTGREVLAW